MMLRLLALLLVLPRLAAAEGLTAPQAALLARSRFEVKDGSVIDPATGRPVPSAELPYLIERLESAQRLKALVEVNIILNKSEGEKRLTPEEREAIRRILRESWPQFTLHSRRQFRSYFSLQELESLDQTPPPVEAAAWTPPAAPESSAAQVAVNAVVPAVLMPATVAVTPAAPAIPPPPPSAAAVAVAAPSAPELGVLKPWTPEATPPPAPAPVAPAAVNAPSEIPKVPETIPLAPPPPPAAEPPPPAPSAPVEAPAPAAPPSPPPPPLSPEEFAKFLAEAQYSRDAKALLQMISERAPGPARRRALGVVVASLPQIVFDAARTGAATRSRLIAPDIVALNPAIALQRRRKLFGGSDAALPDAPAYAGLGLPVPALQAFASDAVPRSEESGPWGKTRVYADGSRRVTPTPEQQAGVLLAELLRLESRQKQEPPYAAELGARLAQNLFYARLGQDAEKYLDPDLRLSFRDWRDQPDEFRDHLVRALSSARGSCPQAAAEAEKQAWEATGLFETAPRTPQECAARWDGDLAALTKPSKALAELLESDRDHRMRRQDDARRD